jgi:hypothetical protein
VGKGESLQRADVYLEVRKRRCIYFLNETSAFPSKNVYFDLNFGSII